MQKMYIAHQVYIIYSPNTLAYKYNPSFTSFGERTSNIELSPQYTIFLTLISKST